MYMYISHLKSFAQKCVLAVPLTGTRTTEHIYDCISYTSRIFVVVCILELHASLS